MKLNRQFERRGPLWLPRHDPEKDASLPRFERYRRRLSSIQAAVSYNIAGKNDNGAGSTTVGVTLTVAAGSNMAVLAGLSMAANNATNISVSGAGATGWAVVTGTDSGTARTLRTLIWCAVNPSTGSQTVTATWTTSMEAVMGVVVFNGVNQSTPTANGTFTSGASGNMSVTITATSGDETLDTVVGNSSITVPSQTSRWYDNNPSLVSGAGSSANATGNMTHSWTNGGDVWTQSGVCIKQVSAAAVTSKPGKFNQFFTMKRP